MKVAVVQHDIVWEDPKATHDHLAPMIARAAGEGARLVVLTEMFATGFSMHPERIAEDEGGVSEQFLVSSAVEHDTHLIASIAQRGPDGCHRNNAVVAFPDGSVQRYAKIHPFAFAREHEHYTAGTEYLTVDVDGVSVTVFVCYDLRFADEFWVLAERTDAYVVPANWPAVRREHWRALLRARAIENQAYVIGVNRVGHDDKESYCGDSAVIDPWGRTLVECVDGEAVATVDVAPATVSDTRKSMPFLQDRREILQGS